MLTLHWKTIAALCCRMNFPHTGWRLPLHPAPLLSGASPPSLLVQRPRKAFAFVRVTRLRVRSGSEGGP